MIQRLKKAKENKKGFTLVELIVVLVILAILIALLVPALTGYIDKANKRKIETEARNALMACQTLATELYGESDAENPEAVIDETKFYTEAKELSEVPGTISDVTLTTAAGSKGDGKIETMTYENKGYTIVYDFSQGGFGDVSDKGGTANPPAGGENGDGN